MTRGCLPSRMFPTQRGCLLQTWLGVVCQVECFQHDGVICRQTKCLHTKDCWLFTNSQIFKQLNSPHLIINPKRKYTNPAYRQELLHAKVNGPFFFSFFFFFEFSWPTRLRMVARRCLNIVQHAQNQQQSHKKGTDFYESNDGEPECIKFTLCLDFAIDCFNVMLSLCRKLNLLLNMFFYLVLLLKFYESVCFSMKSQCSWAAMIPTPWTYWRRALGVLQPVVAGVGSPH